MAKMKKSAAPVRRPASDSTGERQDACEDTAGLTQRVETPNAKKSIAAKSTTSKAANAGPSAAKSPRPQPKQKRKALEPTLAALVSPHKRAKGKDAQRQQKKASACASEDSSTGGSIAAGDSAGKEDTSQMEADSDGKLDRSVEIGKRQSEIPKEERPITESACRKHLAMLRSEDKRPPPPISAATFASKFRLPHEGINSHKLKIGRDINLEEVQDVFGHEKSKNGFALAEKLSPALRKDAEKLYCLCYQKPYAPPHVAKEFAIGFVLDKVNGRSVNWAEFAAETNVGQRKSYLRRLKACMQRLAKLLSLPINEVYIQEGFPEYAEKSSDKVLAGDERWQAAEGDESKGDALARASVVSASQVHICLLAARKAEVTNTVRQFQSLLQNSELQLEYKKAAISQAVVQWNACFHLVDQFQSSLTEAGHDCEVVPPDDEMEAAATKQVGLGPILKMYYSNVKKLRAYAATKTTLEEELHVASAVFTANSKRLAALEAYLGELEAGQDVVLMRPLPSCSPDEDAIVNDGKPALPPLLQCTVCSAGFLVWDVILCTCQHVYHPWCAVQCFRNSITCAAADCIVVPAAWYKSWGFGSFEKLLNDLNNKHEARTHTEAAADVGTTVAPTTLVRVGLPTRTRR